MIWVLILLVAYLVGAIPTSVWFGRLFYRRDVRNAGSGNAGATNTFRVLGPLAGILVLIMDIGKGAVAAWLPCWLAPLEAGTPAFFYGQMASGMAAAIGHIYPVYLRFKGGKGVAAFFGVVLVLFPWAALAAALTFLAAFLPSRYVSLGSILASLAFSLALLVLYTENFRQGPVVVFAAVVPAIILYTHRQNISRLLQGKEHKINFSSKTS